MGSDTGVIDYLDALTSHFWLVAIVFFGVGDLLTTGVGLSIKRVVEIGPLAAPVYQQFGLIALVPLKLATLGGAYALWAGVPTPHNIGVPLGLSALGVVITLWNLSVLVAAL